MPSAKRRTEAPQSRKESSYTSPICKILVGDTERVFKVHKELLQRTSFFEQHNEPVQDEQKGHDNKRAGTASAMFFDDNARQSTVNPDTEHEVIDLVEHADYILQDSFFYEPDAWAVFQRHLYDALPVEPRTCDECITLFKAYALAQLYKVELLQNEIVDALQRHYNKYQIPITHLMYVVQHWGDNAHTYLASYLIAQCGYEMAKNWEQWRPENEGLLELYASGHKVIIEQLTLAAMGYAKSDADPARHKRNWRFQL